MKKKKKKEYSGSSIMTPWSLSDYKYGFELLQKKVKELEKQLKEKKKIY